MRILVLSGDYYHSGEAAKAGLSQLEEAGFEFDWIEDAKDWPVTTMLNYPVVLITKSDHTSHLDKTPWMTPEVELTFQDYVRRGNGLLAVHSGTAGYAHTKIFRELLGGVFNYHPDQCEVTAELRRGYPLAEEIKPFTLFDEHYFMDTEPGNHIFLTTHSEHGTQPGGWTRLEGQGRVCVLTPGHNPQVWLNSNYQALIQRALKWLSGTMGNTKYVLSD